MEKKGAGMWRDLPEPLNQQRRPMAYHETITRLLHDLKGGWRAAFDELLPHVYDELRCVADFQLRGERADHTINTTALVHEAYLKLVDRRELDWQSRVHFYAVAAMAMTLAQAVDRAFFLAGCARAILAPPLL